jgi:uncharacterized membrane protein
MIRTLSAVTWILFAALLYLIAAEAVAPWMTLPGFGNVGFTLVFMLFSVLHCARTEGWARTGLFFALAAVVSFLFEEAGVRTGLIYGSYHYSDLLGAKLGHVPVLIPLAWFMMIYPSWLVARTLLRAVDTDSMAGTVAAALIASMVMTAWDTVMDPGMAAAGNWVWENGGPYFGVPLRNYFGWLLTTFVVYLGAGCLFGGKRSRLRQAGLVIDVTRDFAALPVIVYAAFGLRYVASAEKIPALHVVALFAMGLPGLLALILTYLPRRAAEVDIVVGADGYPKG